MGRLLCVVGQAPLPPWAPLNAKRWPIVIPKGLSALASSVVLQPPAPLREHF